MPALSPWHRPGQAGSARRWEWLAELLEDAGQELHLARPLRTEAIAAARVRIDAVDTAHFGLSCCAPTCWWRPTWLLASCATCCRHRWVLVRRASLSAGSTR
jgi:hypothetical protein